MYSDSKNAEFSEVLSPDDDPFTAERNCVWQPCRFTRDILSNVTVYVKHSLVKFGNRWAYAFYSYAIYDCAAPAT